MSRSFPHAVEISLVPGAGHWLGFAAGALLPLLSLSALDPLWRPLAAALWAVLVAPAAARLAARPWPRATWQPSGAFRLQGRDGACLAQLGRHSYRSRHVIVLHMTRGNENWYFPILRRDQPDAFRRCAARLRQAAVDRIR